MSSLLLRYLILLLLDRQIKLMNEEIDELNSSLRDIRLENEEEIEFLRSKVVSKTSINTRLFSGTNWIWIISIKYLLACEVLTSFSFISSFNSKNVNYLALLQNKKSFQIVIISFIAFVRNNFTNSFPLITWRNNGISRLIKKVNWRKQVKSWQSLPIRCRRNSGRH